MLSNKISAEKFSMTTCLTVLFGTVYIFLFQMKLPFNSNFLLYGMLITMFFSVIKRKKLYVNLQTLLFGFVAFISFVGIFYSSLFSRGLEEAVLFIIYFLIFLLGNLNENLIKKFIKWCGIFSLIVSLSVIIQSLIPDSFLSFASKIMKTSCLENLSDSYSVDGAYAGISAYTVNAAFFAVVGFVQAFVNIFEKKTYKLHKKAFILNLFAMLISFYAIILTSKRGIFIGLIVSIILSLSVIYRKHGSIFKILIVLLALFILIYVLYSTNSFITHFVDRFNNAKDFTTGRDVIYREVLNYFDEGNVFFGNGTASTYKVVEYGAHNIYLQILNDHGVLLGFPYLVLFIFNLFTAIKKHAVASIFIECLFLIYGFSGNPLYTSMFMLIYVFYVLYANLNLKRNEEIDENGNSHIS